MTNLGCSRIAKIFAMILTVCFATTAILRAQTFTTLYSFSSHADGTLPNAPTQGADGNLYGTTAAGGPYALGYGTIFRITPEGKLTTIYAFCSLPNCADGEAPGGLLLASNGKFYGGTQEFGGAYGNGEVFQITAEGVFGVLYSFCQRRGCPDGQGAGGLIQASNGNLYGITGGGAAHTG